MSADAIRNLRLATGLDRPISRELAFINAKNLQRKKFLDQFVSVFNYYYEKLDIQAEDLDRSFSSLDSVAHYLLLQQLCETIKSGQLDLFSESISHFIIDKYTEISYNNISPLDELIFCLLQTSHSNNRWKIAAADRLTLLESFMDRNEGMPAQSWKVALEEGLLSDISEQERKNPAFQLLAAAKFEEILTSYANDSYFFKSEYNIDFWALDALFPLLDVRYFDPIFITKLWMLATTADYKFVKDFIALLLRKNLPLTPEVEVVGYVSQSPILNMQLKMRQNEYNNSNQDNKEKQIKDTSVVTANILDNSIEWFLNESDVDPKSTSAESIANFIVGLELLLSQPYYKGKVTLDQVLDSYPGLRAALNFASVY